MRKWGTSLTRTLPVCVWHPLCRWPSIMKPGATGKGHLCRITWQPEIMMPRIYGPPFFQWPESSLNNIISLMLSIVRDTGKAGEEAVKHFSLDFELSCSECAVSILFLRSISYWSLTKSPRKLSGRRVEWIVRQSLCGKPRGQLRVPTPLHPWPLPWCHARVVPEPHLIYWKPSLWPSLKSCPRGVLWPVFARM